MRDPEAAATDVQHLRLGEQAVLEQANELRPPADLEGLAGHAEKAVLIDHGFGACLDVRHSVGTARRDRHGIASMGGAPYLPPLRCSSCGPSVCGIECPNETFS